MPSGEKESQDEVVRLLSERLNDGCVAHLRALVVREEGEWIAIGGRVDVARPEDRPLLATTPVGGARLLNETVSLDELRRRLEAAFAGRPFLVGEEELVTHGMNSPWSGGRYTDSWAEYGTGWPVVELAPNNGPARQVYLHNAYEARGEVEALDGIIECVRFGLGYVGVRSVSDVRGKRFGICLWDYRGVIRHQFTAGAVRFAVEPPNDPSLTLSMVARDDSGIRRASLRAPAVVPVPLAGALHRLNMTLRHRNDIVCELLWDESTERFRLRHDGFYVRPPVGPEADPIDAGSTIAKAALPFIADGSLADMVARDMAELDSAITAGNVKSAVVLTGSILESVVLDVLNRNEHWARRALGKKWPDRASAKDLIDAASAITVVLPDSTTRALLAPLTAKKSAIVVDHRDLIHPRAEVRGATTIDTNTVQTMRGVLGEVLRDLREAADNGVLDAYGHGDTA
jgi:hypothetical protein